jgi:hypothetical protein
MDLGGDRKQHHQQRRARIELAHPDQQNRQRRGRQKSADVARRQVHVARALEVELGDRLAPFLGAFKAAVKIGGRGHESCHESTGDGGGHGRQFLADIEQTGGRKPD